MIFVTVGHQMPFDRLIQAVDEWAGEVGRDDVFAQIGSASYEPCHIRWESFLDPDEFRHRIREATALIAHAGTGSILTALEYGKPILVMPRRAALHETRNDHQVATAERFAEQDNVLVALDEMELAGQLGRLDELSLDDLERISAKASPELLRAVKSFIDEPGG